MLICSILFFLFQHFCFFFVENLVKWVEMMQHLGWIWPWLCCYKIRHSLAVTGWECSSKLFSFCYDIVNIYSMPNEGAVAVTLFQASKWKKKNIWKSISMQKHHRNISVAVACNKQHYVAVTQAPKSRQHWNDLWYTKQNRLQHKQSLPVAEATQTDNRVAAQN